MTMMTPYGVIGWERVRMISVHVNTKKSYPQVTFPLSVVTVSSCQDMPFRHPSVSLPGIIATHHMNVRHPELSMLKVVI